MIDWHDWMIAISAVCNMVSALACVYVAWKHQ